MEAVEDLGEMGPLFTRVSFRVRCAETRFGEFVAVCGELPELGAWDPAQALRLYTSPATFPVWQSDTVLIGTYVSSAQYKFVIIPKDDGVVGAPVRWEALLSNRVFTPVGEELSIAHDYGAQGGAGPGHSGPASPELSALDVSAGPTGPEGQLDLPPSLAEVASRARAPQHANPLDGSERVLLVTLRLPVKLERDEDTGQWVGTWDESTMWATSVDGGRAVLTSAGCETVYIGSVGRHVPREEQPAVSKLLEAFGCIPVFIEPWELNEPYGAYIKELLWPLLHFELPSLAFAQIAPAPTAAHYRRSKEQWGAYQVVNQLFANVIKSRLRARDLVWIHGHQLLLVPERISRECRERDVPIGLFLHTPFPSVSLFMALPQRKAVLESMLHSSIIGFHLYEYARNFLIAARRILGLVEPTRGTQHMSSGMLGLEINSRQVVVSVSHVGIEPSIIESRLVSPQVLPSAQKLAEVVGRNGRTVIGGVEWLVSMQGAAIKLMAFESLLEHYEKYRTTVTMLQVCVPLSNTSLRPESQTRDVAAACREIAVRIRQRFGPDSLQYIEVGYVPPTEALRTSELLMPTEEWCVSTRVAVWTMLDVLVVTAIRDGLNMLPFEYVCARRLKGDGGVCVLSEFTGCSRVLNGAIRINPFSLVSVVEALDRALSLDLRDAQARMAKDWAFLDAHTTSSWVQLFVKDLKRVSLLEAERNSAVLGGVESDAGRVPTLQVLLPRKLEVEPLARAYRAATRRVFCFGLDGTLIPQDTVITHLKDNHDFVGRGQAPSPAVLHCLLALAADPANEVHVLSGRGASDMSAIFGSIDRLGLAAELGYLQRAAGTRGEGQWVRHAPATDSNQWRQEAKGVMHWFTTRTNGSYSRWQQSAAVWCYHDADPDFGRYQGKQMHLQLVQQLAQYPVTVVHSLSKRTVEVRIRAVNKGLTVDAILCQPNNRQADFVLCCGDDHSDEYMFSAAIARARAPLPALGGGSGETKGAAPSRRTFNVTVGRKPSRATLYVEDTRQVLFFLGALTQHAITGTLGQM